MTYHINRNKAINHKYANGATVQQLSAEYRLAPMSIEKIVGLRIKKVDSWEAPKKIKRSLYDSKNADKYFWEQAGVRF